MSTHPLFESWQIALPRRVATLARMEPLHQFEATKKTRSIDLSAYDMRTLSLMVAARMERIAEAAIRFAEIRGKESELNALVSIQNEILVTQKPILDELRMFGAHYSATLGGELLANEAILNQAKGYLSKLVSEHKEADGRLKTGLQTHTRLESELASINQRLVQRDLRRADLRTAGIVESKEKALSAINRWKQLELNLKNEIEQREVYAATIEAELAQLTQTESGLALKRQSLNTDASTRDDIYQRGIQSADILRKSRPIIEVTSSDAADPDQPDLLILLRSRESKLLDSILQARVDGEDDKRTLHSIETDRLFPPSREVEITNYSRWTDGTGNGDGNSFARRRSGCCDFG